MSDGSGGFEWSIVEIVEISVAVLLFIIIGTAIIIAPQTDFIELRTTGKELSYITNLITNTNINIKTKYPDTEIAINSDQLSIKSTENIKIQSNLDIYGTEHTIKKIKEDIYCISSYKDCDDNTQTIKIDDRTSTKENQQKNNDPNYDKINYNGP